MAKHRIHKSISSKKYFFIEMLILEKKSATTTYSESSKIYKGKSSMQEQIRVVSIRFLLRKKKQYKNQSDRIKRRQFLPQLY